MNPTKKQPKWKRLLPSVLWTLAGTSLFILLVSAMGRNGRLRCTGLEISIEGYKHEMFISEADVKALIEDNLPHTVKGCAIDVMNLRRLENLLQKDSWVSKAQLFIDNKQLLHVNISERLPVARIFTQSARSYYIDSDAVILPLSQQQIADVPVFTNMPDRPQKLTSADSIFWQQLGQMGNYIINDSFLLMQVGQINVTPQKQLELFPVIGNHIILFGSPDKYDQKLSRLKRFDKQILAKAGLSKYSRLDLRYDKQIVATLRGTESVSSAPVDIRPETLMVSALAMSTAPESEHETAKVEVKSQEKKIEHKTAASPKKEPVKKETVKKEIKKIDRKSEKVNSTVQNKRPSNDSKKIIVAASNKTDKNTLKQLPKNVNKFGITEVDIRKERQEKKNTQPRAVMPKKE